MNKSNLNDYLLIFFFIDSELIGAKKCLIRVRKSLYVLTVIECSTLDVVSPFTPIISMEILPMSRYFSAPSVP